MRLTRRLIFILAGIALLPLFAVLVTATVAGALGCEVSEAGPTPCIVYGIDIGGPLASLMVTGWFSLLTIPMLMGLVFVWAVFELYVWRRQRRRARRATRESNA